MYVYVFNDPVFFFNANEYQYYESKQANFFCIQDIGYRYAKVLTYLEANHSLPLFLPTDSHP